MKLPLFWLKEYIPTPLTAEEIGELLTSVGLEVEDVHDDLLDIAITPNLAHCASIKGISRELAAVLDKKLTLPEVRVEEQGTPLKECTSVIVENQQACPRYACRVITDVKVGPSPDWLKQLVEQCGWRSVNNVVDATNLVLMELGQPLHAFDLDLLHERRIVVRNAKKGEKIIALDGKEYYPNEEILLICDAKRPVAIAGIMGSLDSEVTENTTAIFLESAYFEPSQIRRASKRLDVRSEASYHFERGCDPNGVLEALDRATQLICKFAGGKVLQGALDIKARDFPPLNVSCRLSRINRLLGTQLALSEVETIFRRLGLNTLKAKDDVITVSVPTYRHDITQEIDLIEETARLYGYDNIHKKEQAYFRTGLLTHSPEYKLTRKTRCRLIAEGLQEFLTCDLISPAQAAWISKDNFPTRSLIKLLNPHSVEHSVLRPSLLPGILSVVKYNADHGIDSIAGFEVGRVHFTSKDTYFEPFVASIVLTGERSPFHWESKNVKADFFDLKGIIENLLSALNVSKYSFAKSSYENFHPKRQAKLMIGNVEVGIVGEIHPATLKNANLEQPVYFAELHLDELQTGMQTAIKMQPIPLYPASSRDWTITLSETVPVGSLLGLIEEEKSRLLESVQVLDIYRSDKIGTNRKNVTFRFVYRDPTKTIDLSTVETEHLRITNKLANLQEEIP